MRSDIISTTSDAISSGGTITGDLTISGDLTVSGSGGFDYSEVLTGDMKITNTLATIALEISQAHATASALSIDAETTTGASLYVDSGALTSGNIAKFHSNTSDATTRNLVVIINEHASAAGARTLALDQDGDANSILIDSEATTDDVFLIENPTSTSGDIILISGADALTTGAAISIDSGGTALASTATGGLVEILHTGDSDSNVNNLLYIVNDDAGSTGTTGLKIQQDSTGPALMLTGADIAHGMTDRLTFTDEFFSIQKWGGANGGGYMLAASDADSEAFVLEAFIGATDPTDTEAAIWLKGGKKGGSTSPVALGASETVFKLDNYGTNIITALGSGNVGIGTTAPGSSAGANALDIRDTNTSSATQGASLRLGSNDGAVMGATHRMGVIEFAGAEDGGGTMVGGARIDAFAVDAFTATGTYDHNSKLQFAVQSGTSGTDQLASPAMVLDANSRISLSNNDASGAVGTTLFGYNAGLNIVSGCIDNTFIGHAVADATLTNAADYNTGVGGSSLSSLTSGYSNAAFGFQSLFNNTDGFQNTAIGTTALYHNAGTDNNTAVGDQAGFYTQGASNTYIGQSAGKGTAGADANNVGVGANALTAITTGSSNVAIGKDSLDAITDAAQIIGIGENAGGALASSTSNGTIAIGHYALSVLSGAVAGNVVIGKQAGQNTTGANNTYVGLSAGLGASGADANNVGVGANALLAVTTGIENVAVGKDAGDAITTANGCVIIGTDAGQAISTTGGSAVSDGSVSIGWSSMKFLTSGHGNIGIGYQSLKNHTTGSRNIAIGYNAMDGTGEDDSPTSTDNVFIGYDAGGGAWDDGADGTAVSNFNVGVGNYVMDAAMVGH